MSYSPWGHVARLTDVVVGFRDDLPSGVAWWSPKHQVILLARDLGQRERRVALAHELAHIDLGHSGVEEYGDADRQDQRLHDEADQLAARRLIPITRLADALKWSRDPEEIAEALWVTVPLLRVRVEHLHPVERHALRRVLIDAEVTA